MASLGGSSLYFYNLIPYWDKYTHCFSGVLGVVIAYLLYSKLQENKEDNKILKYIFINAVNISIAAIWELYEYATLVLFDYDAINHYTTGVHDSMTDIVVCLLGGMFACYFIYRCEKKGTDNFLLKIKKKL